MCCFCNKLAPIRHRAFPTIPNDVFFTRDEYERYSFHHHLKDYLLQKEQELRPDSVLFNADRDDPVAEKTTNGQATHPQEMLQLGAAGQSLSEQELSSPSSRTDTKRTQTHQPSEAVPVMMTQAVTPVPSVQNQESGPSTVIKGETSKSKNPQMNPWAEVLTSRTESEAGVCAIGRKPAVSKWYPKLPYPRPSWLTMQDQADYLDLLARQADARQHKPLETKEMAHFKELHQKVSMEQEEFIRYLESYAANFPDYYQTLHQDAAKFVNEYLGHLCERVTSYPQFYVQLDSVTLLPPRNLRSPFMLTHLRALLELGQVPRVLLPNMKGYVNPKIPLDYKKVIHMFPATCDDSRKPACSFDNNAEALAMKYDADIVISSAGIKCLIDNHGPHFDRQWELPVVIKEYKVQGEFSTQIKKVIYIDKPFPPKSRNTREKNAWYHKFATKCSMQHPKHPKSHSFSTSQTLKEDEDCLMTEGVTLLADLETFGAASTTSLNRPSAFKRYIRPESKKGEHTPRTPSECSPKSGKGDDNSQSVQTEVREANNGNLDKLLMRSSSEGFTVSVGDPLACSREKDQSSTDVHAQPPMDICDKGDSHEETDIFSIRKQSDPPSEVETTYTPGAGDTPKGRDLGGLMDSHDQLVIETQLEGDQEQRNDNQSGLSDMIKQPVRDAEDQESQLERKVTIPTAKKDSDVKTENNTSVDVKDVDITQASSGKNILRPTEEESSEVPSPFDFPKGEITSQACSTPASSPCGAEPQSEESEDEASLVIDIPSTAPPERRITRQSLRSNTSTKGSETASSTLPGKPPDTLEDHSSPGGRKNTSGTGRKQLKQTPEAGADLATGFASDTEEAPSPKTIRSRTRLSGQPPSGVDCGLGQPLKRMTRSQGSPGRAELKRTASGLDVEEGTKGLLEDTLPRAEMSSLPTLPRRGRSKRPHIVSTAMTPASPLKGGATITRQHHHDVSEPDLVDETNSTTAIPAPVKVIPLEPIQTSPASVVLPPHSSESMVQENPTDPVAMDMDLIEHRQELSPEGAEHSCKTKDISTARLASKKSESGQMSQKRQRDSTAKSMNSEPLSMLDCIMKAQDKFLKSTTKPTENPASQAAVVQCVPEEAVPAHMTSDDWKPAEDPSEYKSHCQNNVTYNLWALGNLRVLIRCGYHGNVKIKKHPNKPGRFVQLHPKLEYQPFFGAEQVAASEAARMWLDSYIRNAAKIIRVRINAFTSEVMLLDQMDSSKILSPTDCFNPLAATTVLHTVLDKLSKLPSGHYLLGHVPGNMHAHIKKTVETTSGVYDLHYAYLSGKPVQDKSPRVPWIPIDPNIQLFYHRKFKRVPATFEPKDSPNLKTKQFHGGKPGSTVKTKNKKKKKKKKP